MHSKVAVIRVDPNAPADDLYIAIGNAINTLGDVFGNCPKSGTVLLKPNYGVARKDYCVNPAVTFAVTRILVDHGFKTLIGEDPSVSSNSGYNKWKHVIHDYIGLEKFADTIGAQVVDLRNGGHRTVKVKEPLYFKEIEISDYALDVDMIVSLAKMKMVNVCSVSLSLKNIKGVMRPEWKHRFHCNGLNQGIVDLNKTIKPHIAIIDATFAQDQVARKHFPVGLIIISNNCVAADAVCTRIMGLDPADVEHIMLAQKAGFGTAKMDEIEVIGEKLENLIGKFKFSNPVSPFEHAKKSGGDFEIIQGNPCSACLNELGNDLMHLGKNRNKLKNAAILVGPKAKLPDNGRSVILYGNCLKKYRDKGVYINGCPPTCFPCGTDSLKKHFSKV